jgi:hypothetical protein
MKKTILTLTTTAFLTACSGITLPITDQTGNYHDNNITLVNACGSNHTGSFHSSVTTNLNGTPPNHTIRITTTVPTLDINQNTEFVTPTTQSIQSPPLTNGVITGKIEGGIFIGTWHAKISCPNAPQENKQIRFFARKLS